MRKFLVLATLLFTFSALAEAQQTVSLQWDYAAPVADVKGYTQVVVIDGTAQTAAIACVAVSVATSTCTIPAPVLATGNHTATVTATRNNVSVSATQANLNMANGPATPGGFKVVVTVTVTGTP